MFEDCTVTGVSPLRIRRDADVAELPFTPDTLIDARLLAVNDRVRCEFEAGRVIVWGKQGGTLSAIWENEYDVGDIYVTTSKTTAEAVAAKYGGTWEAFGAGRVMVGVDATQSEFDAVEKTGGAKTVTLTAAQSGLPSHVHSAGRANDANIGGATAWFPADDLGGGSGNTNAAGGTDASAAHTNLQPYIAVFLWKRVA